MKLLIGVTVIAVFISCSVAAQKKQGQARLDSLLAEVPKMKEDKSGAALMSAIAFAYSKINPGEGQKWAKRELALAQKLDWQKGEAIAYNDLGNIYLSIGSYPAALDAYFKALRMNEARGDMERIGTVSGNIGGVYSSQKEYSKALEWVFKALRIAEKRGDKKRTQNALGNIGYLYNLQGKPQEALHYQLKSLRIAEELNSKEEIGLQTGNIGSTYSSLKQYNTALAYDFKALRIAEALGRKQTVASIFGGTGIDYYLIATDTADIKGDSLVPASRAANLAKAVEYLNKGIAACRETQFLEDIPEFSQYLSDALAQQGDYRGAMAAYKQSVAAKDSLYNTANNEAISNLETKRAVELKDKDIQIAKLKKRNERVLFAGGFAVLLLVLGILFRNYRRQQHSNQLLSREKQRSDDLLLNILPAEVAEELKSSGGAQARQFDNVTVLFTDFVNFTGTAEQLSPQVLVKELHECFTAFDAIMERHGLEKIKTVGDAYIAVGGLPNTDPRHAQHCVQAAIDILQFMEERGRNERVFGIRIGINSGAVVAGIVGVKKFAYDIWGDTVNTAARMEQHGERGRINISQSTYELVKENYRCEQRGKIAAKNKGEVEMYFVEAQLDTPAHA